MPNQSTSSPTHPVIKILFSLLLLLIIGRFAVVGLPKVLFNQISSDGDESAYLALGLALLEDGTLSDGTRPWLYPLLLTPFAEREWAYFTNAKLLTLGLGALTVAAVFMAGLRLYGWPTALLAAFLLSINREFHNRAATVYADTLLALVMVGAWYFLIRSIDSPNSQAELRNADQAAPAKGFRRTASIFGGIFIGLAFMTKGSAPILLVAWGLTALLQEWPFRVSLSKSASTSSACVTPNEGTPDRVRLWTHVKRVSHLLLVPLAFVITASPLLIYNSLTFGSPTYNFATQHVMWMDRWAESQTGDPSTLPTVRSYIATHDLTDIAARLDKGFHRLNPLLSRTLNPNRSFNLPWLDTLLPTVVFISFLGLLVYTAVYNHKQAVSVRYTVFLCGLFYVSLLWYVAGAVAESRFVTPLLGPIYLLLAWGVITLWQQGGQWVNGQHRWLGWLYAAVSGMIILGGSGWLVNSSRSEMWALSVNPYEVDRQANQEVEQVVDWFTQDSPHEAASISFGPSKSLPLWKFPPQFTLKRLPVEIDSWAAVEAYWHAQQPTYIVLDDDTVRRRRQALLGPFQRQEGLISFERIPDPLALAWLYPAFPCRWCIFSPTRSGPALAEFEPQIELLAYRVTRASPTQLRVSLTWQSTASQHRDYTAFVHLTALDGFVKAQQDQAPFQGSYPTSRWNPHEQLTDRYDLFLDETVTPGEYLLLAGMYDPATGERLTVLTGERGPSPNTVRLTSITLE